MERTFQRPELKAEKVWFDTERIFVQCSDGRIVGNPIVWYPLLAKSTIEQRNRFELICRATGIHWPEIDEDISVEGMFRF